MSGVDKKNVLADLQKRPADLIHQEKDLLLREFLEEAAAIEEEMTGKVQAKPKIWGDGEEKELSKVKRALKLAEEEAKDIEDELNQLTQPKNKSDEEDWP